MKLIATSLFLAASVFAAKHYSYTGRDPAAWTVSEIRTQASASPAGWTTYLGDANEYQVTKIITDAAGNTYVTGSRVISSLTDIFVTKLNSAGTIVFTATISGKGNDQANDIALDPAGNIYIAGNTSSTNFPLRNALQTARGSGFVVKLSPDGSRLIYSTYFGGTAGPSFTMAIAADASGAMYVGGTTNSSDFTATPGLPSDHPSFGVAAHGPAFVAKIAPAGDRIVWAALIGGNAVACGAGSSCFLSGRGAASKAIALDGEGNVVIAGNSNVTDLPVTPGALVGKGGIGAFAAKIKGDGTGMVYLTYFSLVSDPVLPFTEPRTVSMALALDSAGSAYIAGYTTDPKFPVTAGALQTTYAGSLPPNSTPNAFVAKLNPTGTAMVWATYLGGAQPDRANAIAVDAAGNTWVTGATSSPEFPNANGWSGNDFLVGINPAGAQLVYSGRFPQNTASQSAAVDSAGVVHIAGAGGIVSTIDPAQALSARIFGIANAAFGNLSGRIAPGELISIYGPHIGPATPASFTVENGLVPNSLAGVQVTIGGLPAPVLYVSDQQINAVVPFEVQGDSAPVIVSLNGAALPAFRTVVLPTAPQIFRNSDGSAAAVNQDGSLNSPQNPAKAGEAVSIWATGTGAVALADGQIQTAADNTFCCEVSADGNPGVLYAGAAPGLVAGVSQINFRIPAVPAPAATPLYVAIVAGEKTSDAAAVYVTE